MLDGRLLIDAHVHAARLPTLKPAWRAWAEEFGQPGWAGAYSEDGTVVPAALDELMAAEGVDHAILLCEYSPKVTGIQPVEDLLPVIKYNPDRFAFLANINPHLHYPVAAELARQLDLGAAGLKIHPVHGGFSAADPALYPAYQLCQQEGVPVVVHSGTSSFPGSDNAMADPALLSPVLRDFPGLTLVLAHGGRGWWYEAAASLALLYENVWIELSGLPPRQAARLLRPVQPGPARRPVHLRHGLAGRARHRQQRPRRGRAGAAGRHAGRHPGRACPAAVPRPGPALIRPVSSAGAGLSV